MNTPGGRIQRGEQLTLSLELLDAVTENVIWSGKYDRKQADVVTLQSEIARDVSNKLKTRLSGADAAKVEKGYTADPEAYKPYQAANAAVALATLAELRRIGCEIPAAAIRARLEGTLQTLLASDVSTLEISLPGKAFEEAWNALLGVGERPMVRLHTGAEVARERLEPDVRDVGPDEPAQPSKSRSLA